MIQNKKSSKGITLISMVLAVIVLMIIIGTISYSSRNSFQVRSLQNLYSDIDSLNDAVSVYYMKNKLLPIYTSYYDYNGTAQEYGYITLPNTYDSASNTYFFNFKEDGRDADTDEKNIYFGIIDIDKIKSTNLNEKNNLPEGIGSGNFFKPNEGGEVSDLENLKQSIKDGIFVMNMSTHKVYYTKGISSDGKKYYARNVYSKGPNYFAENDLINVPIFSKKDNGQSLDETILSQGDVEEPADAIKVKFFANGGSGAPSDVVITQEMLATNSYLASYIPTTVPTRTGMIFKGWSFTTTDTTGKYTIASAFGHGSYYSFVQVSGEDIMLPSNTYTPGSTISLYAIWEVKDDVLLCYYPDDTGGIKPEISTYSVSRTSPIPDGVTNYLCIDIESSGYTLSWDWDYSETDEKEALYEGTKTINITNENSYITTEPGTIKLKGSFSNLTVSIENGDKFKFKINETDLLNIYNMKLGMNRRDLVGAKLNTQWLVGKNRAFIVPENLQTYRKIGILDPASTSGSTYYVDRIDTTSQYFLKKMVVVEENASLVSDIQDFENDSYRLGKVAKLPEDNKNYSIYPYFAARNYRLSSSNPENTKLYYQDSLQEVYDDSVELKDEQYDKITVLNNINIAKIYAENIYEPKYDPSCTSTVTFDEDNVITIYGNGYYINRQKNIEIGKTNTATNITIDASSSSGIKFDSNSNNIILYGNSKLTLDGGCRISSNTTRNIIRLFNDSNLTILKATVENTNANDTEYMISTYGRSPTVCLGCENSSGLNISDSNKDSDITLKNPNGYVLDVDRGALYWNYGILYTKDVTRKGGYTTSTENFINTAGVTRKPCISRSGTDYKIQLDTRVWQFKDNDGESDRTYYSNSLYNAHDMFNITEKVVTDKTLKFTKDTMTIADDSATITKDVVLDYNTDSSNYISSTNSLLVFNHDSTIKNCYMNLSTSAGKDGISIGKSSSVTLNLEYSDICFNNGRYCVYNNKGVFNLRPTAEITGNANGIYTVANMETNIWGDVLVNNAACVNRGTINIYSGGSLNSTGSYALNNYATANINSYSSLSSSGGYTLNNSGTTIINDYATITNSKSGGCAVNSSSSLTSKNVSIRASTGNGIGLKNSGTATLQSTSINAYTCIENNSGGNLSLSSVTINANSSGNGITNKATLSVYGGSLNATNGYVLDSQSTSASARFYNGNPSLRGDIRVRYGNVYFNESSGTSLESNTGASGCVYVQGGNFTMGYCDDDIRTSSPKVNSVRVTSGWFYFYDGNAGALSAGGRVTIPTTSLPYQYVISNSGGAHIVKRTYDSPGTGNESYWQEGVHYNADGSTPYVEPEEEEDIDEL